MGYLMQQQQNESSEKGGRRRGDGLRHGEVTKYSGKIILLEKSFIFSLFLFCSANGEYSIFICVRSCGLCADIVFVQCYNFVRLVLKVGCCCCYVHTWA